LNEQKRSFISIGIIKLLAFFINKKAFILSSKYYLVNIPEISKILKMDNSGDLSKASLGR